MPRWPPLLVLACMSSCTTTAEVRVDSTPPALVVEPTCGELDSTLALYFDNRIGLRLPPGVATDDLRRFSSNFFITDDPVAVGCDRAPVRITVVEVDPASIPLQNLLEPLLRGPLRLEFIRVHLDGFSIAMSDGRSTEPRHFYVRVMRPAGDPSRYHAIQFIVRSQDWEMLLPTLTASVESMARPWRPPGND